MKTNLFSTADGLTEIVFANRHKDYGAYTLRRDYNQRLNQSLLATVAGLALLFLIFLKFSPSDSSDLSVEDNDTVNMTDEVPSVAQPKPKDIQPSTPQQQKENLAHVQITDTATAIVDTTTSHQVDTHGTDTSSVKGNIKGNGNLARIDSFKEDNTIVQFAEVMPEFPGGMNALSDYLSKHINCGSIFRERGESGNVIISLVVGKDGSVTDVKVLRDQVGLGCAEQAMDVIRNMPKWKPGKQGDRPVNVQFMLPVTYQKL